MIAHTHESIAADTAAFLAKGKKIPCYNSAGELVGYKTSDHGGEPDISAAADDEMVEIVHLAGGSRVSIHKAIDGTGYKVSVMGGKPLLRSSITAARQLAAKMSKGKA